MQRSLHWSLLSVLRSCLVAVLFLPGGWRVEAETAKGSWDSRFTLPPGLDGTGLAMASVGNYLVVGGSFTRAGKVEARNLALWDGKNWKEFAGGANGPVTAMVLNSSGLYIGGSFSSVGGVLALDGVARWNGFKWEGLNQRLLHGGIGLPGRPGGLGGIKSLYWQNGCLYAGGTFSELGGVTCNRIAYWDGRSWHDMGGGVALSGNAGTASVDAVTGDGRNIYVGGLFTQAGSVQATNLARWDGKRWFKGGDFVNEMPEWYSDPIIYSRVEKLAFSQGSLYVAGTFSLVNGSAITNFAKWNGVNWQSAGAVDGVVNGMREYNGGLLVAGSFRQIGGVMATNLALLKNGKWSGLGVETFGNFYSVHVDGSRIFMTGSFDHVNGVSARNIVQYDGGKFSAFGSWKGNSLSGGPRSLVTDGVNVYAAGNFDTAGAAAVSGVAKWDGTKWSSLGKPFRNTYLSRPARPSMDHFGGFGPPIGIRGSSSLPQVAAIKSHLYFAGNFSMEDVGATNLACWNGKKWSAVTVDGTNGSWNVTSMASDAVNLYVSGSLVEMSGGRRLGSRLVRSGVSRWDGTNWFSIPWNGVYGDPLLAVDGSILYMADDHALARWDGQTITDYVEIPGMYSVDLLAAQGDAVYASGYNTNYTRVLNRWNGTGWEQVAVPMGMGGNITCIALNGEKVYLGGYFYPTNGFSAEGLIQWDGSGWKSMGMENRSVSSLMATGNKLYVGGSFLTVGGKESGNFGIWSEGK